MATIKVPDFEGLRELSSHEAAVLLDGLKIRINEKGELCGPAPPPFSKIEICISPPLPPWLP